VTGRSFHEIAQSLARIQAETGCWLIVNDRVDIARSTGARGIQLASHSLQIDEARVVAPDLLMGVSVHSMEEALAAEQSGAAWCVAGTIFETPSHQGRAPARIEFVRRLAAAVRIPVVAIGGIAPQNVAELLEAGAYGVATIRGVGWEHDSHSVREADELMKTRLAPVHDADFVEPVTRYISAYDSVTRRGGNDHPDGERRTPRAGTQ
jgi:thiazole tautomerase (transcriptional regulator TenI)